MYVFGLRTTFKSYKYFSAECTQKVSITKASVRCTGIFIQCVFIIAEPEKQIVYVYTINIKSYIGQQIVNFQDTGRSTFKIC